MCGCQAPNPTNSLRKSDCEPNQVRPLDKPQPDRITRLSENDAKNNRTLYQPPPDHLCLRKSISHGVVEMLTVGDTSPTRAFPSRPCALNVACHGPRAASDDGYQSVVAMSVPPCFGAQIVLRRLLAVIARALVVIFWLWLPSPEFWLSVFGSGCHRQRSGCQFLALGVIARGLAVIPRGLGVIARVLGVIARRLFNVLRLESAQRHVHNGAPSHRAEHDSKEPSIRFIQLAN